MKKLNLFGVIYPDDNYVNATMVSTFLNTLNANEEFEVYINSPGGEVFEGLSIYNLLSEYSSRCIIKIIGEASSIASVISCAGKVLMAETALMLIHKPWTFAIVDEDYIAKLEKELKTIKSSIITAYSRKTGLGEEAIDQMMTDAEYHDATKMVSLGFADEIYIPSETENKLKNQSDKIVRSQYSKITVMNLASTNNKIDVKQTKKEFSMTLEEALTRIGQLENNASNLEANNAIRDKEIVDLRAQNKELTVSNEKLSADNAKLAQENKDFQAKLDKQQQDLFLSEETEFCNKLVADMKMTPAEKEVEIKTLVNFRNSKDLMFDDKTSMYDQRRQTLSSREPVKSLADPLPNGKETENGTFAYKEEMESTAEGRVTLDKEIRARMAKNNTDYMTELQNIRKGA